MDVLAKVFLKTGEEGFILLHIEVQGKKEINFPERMFTYYIRIWDKYKKPITSVAIMTDKFKRIKGLNEISSNYYGTVQRFKYTLIDITGFN